MPTLKLYFSCEAAVEGYRKDVALTNTMCEVLRQHQVARDILTISSRGTQYHRTKFDTGVLVNSLCSTAPTPHSN